MMLLQGRRISRTVIQAAPFQRHALFATRNFSVKELSWCAPTGSPTSSRSQEPTSNRRQSVTLESDNEQQPINQFGIVAAISACKNRVIGINGKLPWSAPEDRRLFKSLTQGSILIIGRRTLEEHPNLGHIDHAKHCIVISKSMNSLAKYAIEDGSPNDLQLSLANSLEEALRKARELSKAKESVEDDIANQDISCWVAGGERLYSDALRHKSLKELRLSWIHMDVPLPPTEDAIPFARFPAKYHWDNKFNEVSKTFHPTTNNTPAFEHCIYQAK